MKSKELPITQNESQNDVDMEYSECQLELGKTLTTGSSYAAFQVFVSKGDTKLWNW
jgi:hypothetical protein